MGPYLGGLALAWRIGIFTCKVRAKPDAENPNGEILNPKP